MHSCMEKLKTRETTRSQKTTWRWRVGDMLTDVHEPLHRSGAPHRTNACRLRLRTRRFFVWKPSAAPHAGSSRWHWQNCTTMSMPDTCHAVLPYVMVVRTRTTRAHDRAQAATWCRLPLRRRASCCAIACGTAPCGIYIYIRLVPKSVPTLQAEVVPPQSVRTVC
jgi:hypothetical protein